MSKHRRQRNRRFQKALETVSVEDLEYGTNVFELRGKMSRRIDPLARVAVLRRLGIRVPKVVR